MPLSLIQGHLFYLQCPLCNQWSSIFTAPLSVQLSILVDLNTSLTLQPSHPHTHTHIPHVAQMTGPEAFSPMHVSLLNPVAQQSDSTVLVNTAHGSLTHAPITPELGCRNHRKSLSLKKAVYLLTKNGGWKVYNTSLEKTDPDQDV